MKIIYHSCINGYITEVVFPQGSEIFALMESAIRRVKYIIGDKIKDVPQEIIEHNCTRGELIDMNNWSKNDIKDNNAEK